MLKIKHRIYKVERGLLVQPTYSQYCGLTPLFKDQDTIEECIAALEKEGECHEHVILPITSWSYDE